MNLTEAKEGEEYIIKEILTDDEELTSFLFSLKEFLRDCIVSIIMILSSLVQSNNIFEIINPNKATAKAIAI